MDAKEELAKLTLGKIVSGLLILAGLLIAIVWRESLAAKWAQVGEGLSKPALMALLGLALIAATLELLGIAYLLFLLYRDRSTTKTPKPEIIKRFGIHWDKDLNPHCPADETLMRPRIHASNRDYDILECPKCNHKYPLRAEDMSSLLLPAAQTLIRQGTNPAATLPEPKMLKQFGVLWDDVQNPHCPVDKTLLTIWSHEDADADGPAYDTLHCPKCDAEFTVRDEHGVRTLFEAKVYMRDHLRRGLISD